MSKMTIKSTKKVVGEALDAMSLMEHDMHYHDGNYRGGKCLFRERMSLGDKSDAALNDANEKEGAIYGGRRYEGRMIEQGFAEEFGIGQKKGTRTQFMEPDEKGNNTFVIWCKGDTPDNTFNTEKVRKFFKHNGYELKGVSIGQEQTKGNNPTTKKIFAFDVYRPEGIQFAEQKNDDGVVRGDADEEETELSEEQKNAALKKFGIKIEDGKYRKRTAIDDRDDNIKKYLNIIRN